jgi:hypothetical protein
MCMRLRLARFFNNRGKKKAKAFLSGGLLLFVAVALFPQEAFGPPSRIMVHPSSGFFPAILDFLLLWGTLFCFWASLKVKSFLREGELSYGWFLFSFSFAFLFIAQLLSLCVSGGFFAIPLTIVSSIRLLSILFLALGIYSIKKVLS